ncbi:MAG: betaine/proline/choline family ABC transporter ATP-binding protein [Chitinivibrionales bacterium]|nr:betaine/proline/choline family ABC transporter ATP-binding protein [Chitinivibrionales bacterium]
MSVLEVKNLYKVFGPNAGRVFGLLQKGLDKQDIHARTGCTIGINDASFTIEKGEIFVVMGLSGSGKSTVLRCLNRIIDSTRGKVLIHGDDITGMSHEKLLRLRRAKVSMVFQHFALLPHRSVIGNTEYGLEISGVGREERQKRARDALKLVGLDGYENSMPDELSGGMKQRVGLARALANDAEILLMDEAFSALDPLIRAQMQDELLELQARMHKTIVFITHDLDEALKLGDRIAIMRDGAIVQIGTPEDILSNPADEYVSTFVQNIDRTKVITANKIMRSAPTITMPREGPQVAIRRMEKYDVSTIYVTDSERRLKGLVTIDDAIKCAEEGKKDLQSCINEDVFVTRTETLISDLISTALMTKYPIAVLNEDNHLVGIVSRSAILAEVKRESDAEHKPMLLKENPVVQVNVPSAAEKEENANG